MLPRLEESRYVTFHHGLLLLKRCHTLLVLCKAGQCRGFAAFFSLFFLHILLVQFKSEVQFFCKHVS